MVRTPAGEAAFAEFSLRPGDGLPMRESAQRACQPAAAASRRFVTLPPSLRELFVSSQLPRLTKPADARDDLDLVERRGMNRRSLQPALLGG